MCNVLYERYLLHSALQKANETIDQYIIHMRHQAENCKFRVLHDEMLQDRLVLGCCNKGAHSRRHWKHCKLVKQHMNSYVRDIRGEDNSVSAVHHKKSTVQCIIRKVQRKLFNQAANLVRETWNKCPAYGKTWKS